MAKTFNHTFGETLVLLNQLYKKMGLFLDWTETKCQKYGNIRSTYLPKKKLRKRIMAIQTDSKTMEEPKDPENCLVFDYYKLFADKEEQAEMAEKYRAGNFGYGHAKQAVFEKVNALLEEPRERYEDLKKRPDDVQDVLNTVLRESVLGSSNPRTSPYQQWIVATYFNS